MERAQLHLEEKPSVTPFPSSRPTLDRWLALVVRYWAVNMDVIHSRGAYWPGFGYTDREKAELRTIAQKIPFLEYCVWVAVFVALFLAILVAVMLVGENRLSSAVGGEISRAPASLFFLSFAVEALASLSMGFPLAMLASAALAGRVFRVVDRDLSDAATTAHYFHKLWFQITRVAILVVIAVIPLAMFVPWDSKYLVIVRMVIPFLSAAVASLTTAYYFSARLQRDDRNARRDN
jgi:hypothetical protein